MIKEKISFKNNLSQNISARIYHGDEKSKKGLIFSHGLFSTKDGYKITRLAESIVNCGFKLMTFDFSFSGESDGNISEISIFQEVEDLKCAIDFFYDYGIEEIHLMGSSMGGFVSLKYLTEYENNIKSLITIATPIDLKGLFRDNVGNNDLSELPDQGYTTVQGIELRNSFFKEINKINIEPNIKEINIPFLIIHGSNDSVVSISNAERLEELLKDNTKSKFVIIDKGGHSLTGDNELEIIKENIQLWICEYK